MEPALLLTVVLLGAFLVVLALIAFAAYRFAAKRAGPPLGAAGGCALATVLVAAGFFALLGFVIVVGLLYVGAERKAGRLDFDDFGRSHRFDVREDGDWQEADDAQIQMESVPELPPALPDAPLPPSSTDVREY